MNTNNSLPKRVFCRKRQGGTLISLVAVMLILSVLGVSVISLTRSSEHSYLSANAGSRAYYLAESGLRYAQQVYCSEDGWLHGRQQTLSMQGGEQVNIIRIAGTFWATGIVNVGTAKEARALVPMPLSLCGEDPNKDPLDEFAVFGDVGISLGTNVIIQGDVAITDEDVEVRGDVEGNVLANDIDLTGHGTITGDIFSSGEVEVTRGTVTGDIHSAAGIEVTSASSTVEGWLFSNGEIDVGGGGTVLGHIHACGADVSIGGNGTVIGSASEPIEIRASGDVYLSGSATVYGVVHAGGAIEMSGSAVINGDAYAGGLIRVGNNNAITGTALQFSPSYVEAPICPDLENLDDLELPEETEFTAGGADVNVPSGSSMFQTVYVLPPGIYGDINSPNNPQGYTSLYLNAGSTEHGNYYFDSVDFGADTALYLNLSGTHDIRIFSVGDIGVGSGLNVFVSTDGSTYVSMTDASVDPEVAARVYWESHGDFDLGSGSNWLGSVYTTEGNLRVGNGSYLIGSYFSGGGHDIIASTVVHIPPNYFTEE